MTSPILAGTGVASEDAEAVDLMELAARRALAAAGAHDLSIDVVLTPKGTWGYGDPGREVARRLGSSRATSVLAELGISQQGLINEGLTMIADGRASVVLVVGGESRRFATHSSMSDLPGTPDQVLERPDAFVDDLEISAGLAFPAVRSYALIERAADARQGFDDAEARSINAQIWASMAEVAGSLPIPPATDPRTARQISEESSDNRLLSAPYLKLHASQWTVDQAAALLLVDQAAAMEAGMDPSAAIYPHVAFESTDVVPVIQRTEISRWPAMGVLGRKASEVLGVEIGSIKHRDLYSCFPIAVRLQAEELGIDVGSDLTVTGGMTFGGGPFNNYVLQSTAAMADVLRNDQGSLGLVTTVSGLLTKPGLAVWSTSPPADGASQVADLATEAAAATAREACRPAQPGEHLVVEASTAWRDGDATVAAVVGRTDDGERALALLHDEASFLRFTAEGCVGEHV